MYTLYTFDLSNKRKMVNKQTLTVGQVLEVTFLNDTDYINCTVLWEIVRLEEKRFYYKKVGYEGATGRAYSLLNRKSVTVVYK